MKLRFYIGPVWTDRSNDHTHVTNPSRQRTLDLYKLERASFQKLVVFVAGIGFFVDGYLLFANNFTLPILGYLYWRDDNSSDHETGINSATLSGAILGQIILGFLADKLGRCRMYGWELLIISVASIGVSMSSQGLDSSMRITPWLVFFRFLAGIGVGAEYPITAVITSEFAPTRHRARMLATVFSMQSIGQLSAALVAFLATHFGLALDSTWRLVYGVGAIPAAVALVFRLTIPESPRYTFDVARNPNQANHDVSYMMQDQVQSQRASHLPASLDGELEFPPKASFGDIRDYFLTKGNWRHLMSTAGAWMLLDLSFFGLGLSSPQIVTGIFNGCSTNNQTLTPHIWESQPGEGNVTVTDLDQTFANNERNDMTIVSSGAVFGSIILIWLVNHVSRRKLQIGGFLILAGFFFTVGAILYTVWDGNTSAAHNSTIVFYVFSQAVFNLGPNGLTFMMSTKFPAEIFPTRYRCSCYGISAAAGKFGSVIAQIALRNVQNNYIADCRNLRPALATVLLGFAVVMLAGAGFAFGIPEVQNKKTKESIDLETLAAGRQQKDPQDMELRIWFPGNAQWVRRRRQSRDLADPSPNPATV